MHSLGDITKLIGVSVDAQAALRTVTGVASLLDAGPTELSYIGSDAYVRQFRQTKASVVVYDRKIRLPQHTGTLTLPVDNAEEAFSKILSLFAPPPQRPNGRHAPVVIADSAKLDPTVTLGPFVVVGERTTIGKNVTIHGGVVIGDDVTIGDNCELYPNVVIRERITIGNRVIIHAGSVLGTDGFGYRWNGKGHEKVPQIGTIVIEDDVELGSCVCVDRAKMGVTRIGRGSKIDNLVQVAHNVQIGPHCIIVGQAGLAGSVKLGAGVIIGGQTGMRDHITMGDGSMAAARSAIAEDVDAGTTVSGMPALPHRQSLREQAAIRRLPDLVVQVRKLQDELKQLQARIDGQAK